MAPKPRHLRNLEVFGLFLTSEPQTTNPRKGFRFKFKEKGMPPTNNLFRLKAHNAGVEFYLNNPHATDVQVDEASPKFNPCRRDFQEAFYFARISDLNQKRLLVRLQESDNAHNA